MRLDFWDKVDSPAFILIHDLCIDLRGEQSEKKLNEIGKHGCSYYCKNTAYHD